MFFVYCLLEPVIFCVFSSVCYQSLGMESGTIRNSEINASSSLPPNMPYDARFRKPNGQGWCAKVKVFLGTF